MKVMRKAASLPMTKKQQQVVVLIVPEKHGKQNVLQMWG